MKNLKFLTFIGFTSLFFACSTDETSTAEVPNQGAVLSSYSTAPTSSATIVPDETIPSSSAIAPTQNPSDSIKDPVIIQQQITVSASGTYEDPYFSSGIFCWTEGCEAEFAQSSSSVASEPPAPADPNNGGGASLDVPSAKEPLIAGNQMVDQRDNQIYALVEVGGKLWTAENMKYEVEGSVCYNDDPANCLAYGRHYAKAEINRVCPIGFHIPTRAEYDFAQANVPWEYAGRINGGDHAYMGDMGFFWLATSEDFAEGDKENCNDSSSNCGMILVVKNPNYSEDEPFKYQRDKATKRFSVRCVQD